MHYLQATLSKAIVCYIILAILLFSLSGDLVEAVVYLSDPTSRNEGAVSSCWDPAR